MPRRPRQAADEQHLSSPLRSTAVQHGRELVASVTTKNILYDHVWTIYIYNTYISYCKCRTFMSEMGFIVSRRGCLHLRNLTYHTSVYACGICRIWLLSWFILRVQGAKRALRALPSASVRFKYFFRRFSLPWSRPSCVVLSNLNFWDFGYAWINSLHSHKSVPKCLGQPFPVTDASDVSKMALAMAAMRQRTILRQWGTGGFDRCFLG